MLGVAWLAALGAVLLQQTLVALGLATLGLVLVATLGLAPVRTAFVGEQRKLTALLNAAPEGVLEIDTDGRIVFVNPQLCALFGYVPAELLGQPIEILVPPAFRQGHAAHRKAFWTSSSSRPMGTGLDISGLRKDGSLIFIDISLNRVQTRRGTAIFCVVRDNSARKAFETKLLENNRRLAESVAALEQNSLELRTLTEMGELLHSSNSEAELYGIFASTMEKLFPRLSGALYMLGESRATASATCVWGAQAVLLDPRINREDCWALRRGRPHFNDQPAAHPRCAHLHGNPTLSGRCIPLLGHGGELLGMLQLVADDPDAVQELAAPARAPLLQALANQFALSSANLRLRETLREQSTIDPLTGLNNRRVLDGYFEESIRRALAERRDIALLLLDIDHFKSFNDRLGHDCGDIALREVGGLLRQSVRHDDVVCRMGGEEFSILLPDTSQQDAEQVAEKLRHGVEALPLQRDGRPLARITVSIGVAVLRAQGETAAALLRRADRALYRAKAAGRNRVVTSGPDDDAGPQSRVTLVPARLRAPP
jgi:diguanylate cyclase (GGDEF)-like protein/PAS domain S-box-containing protein